MKAKTKKASNNIFVVAPGVWGMKDVFVNMYVIDNPSQNNWWLVDTGIRWSGSKIKGMAELLFGAESKPAGIILTHGHFDHVGSVKKLAEEWNVPVYAHNLEIPYLTGVSSYPPADPTAGGGLMSDFSFLYPKGPINIKDRILALPQGGTIPGLVGWKYIHTPGHSAGHISLFRESDRVLIAGDAIVTTKTESLTSTIFQIRKISGPPKYLTSDWLSAAASVEHLAELEPEVIASGHGLPMRGAGMRKSLHNLVRDFQQSSVPASGRYTRQPALMDDSGVVHIPPKNIHGSTAPTLKILGITAGVLITIMLFGNASKKRKKKKELAARIDKQDKLAKYLMKPATHKKAAAQEEIKKIKEQVTEKSAEFKKKLSHEVDVLKDLGGTAKKKAKDVKDRVKEKSVEVAHQIKSEARELKEPALHLLDQLKFNIKRKK